jgi:enoyl-CoA hydratase/carnithine racemase
MGRARSVLSPQSSVLSIRDTVAWLTLPSPLIDVALAQRICDAVEEVEHDQTVRVAVVRNAGSDFGRGVDDPGAWQSRHDWVAAVARLSMPVLAAVTGAAVAEGCELALACDIRLADARASFALPQLVEGHLPRHGATQRLPRLIGRTRALELLLSGRRVSGREAQRIGLVSRVTAAGRLDAALRETVESLLAKGPIALRLAKEAVTRGVDLALEQGIRFEQDLYVLLQTTADRGEGVRAFLAKRRPRFRGR